MVDSGSLGSYEPVVPEGTGVGRPFETDLDIHVRLVDSKEIVENGIALRLVKANNLCGEETIHIERLPSSRGVHANQRVRSLNMLRSSLRVVPVQVGVRRSVDSVLAINDLAEVGGQLLIRRVSTGPERVTTNGRDRVVVQVSNTGRLALMHQVSVPF